MNFKLKKKFIEINYTIIKILIQMIINIIWLNDYGKFGGNANVIHTKWSDVVLLMIARLVRRFLKTIICARVKVGWLCDWIYILLQELYRLHCDVVLFV